MASVKTTLDLPDELLIAAKKQAAEERTSLRKLVARALRRELGSGRKSGESERRIDWGSITADRGLEPGVDISSREAMWDFLERERE